MSDRILGSKRIAIRAPTQERARLRRERILEHSMAYFARHGFHNARMDALARELRISKGSIFQHFGSKENLFLSVFERAVSMLGTYFDAPPDVLEVGFFATVRFWLDQSQMLVREQLIPYRVVLVGNYGVDLALRLEINRFLRMQDPYRTMDFIRMGIERREVRDDLDPWITASTLHWLVERYQDLLVTEELDTGVFRNTGEGPDRRDDRIDQFVELIRGAIGRRSEP